MRKVLLCPKCNSPLCLQVKLTYIDVPAIGENLGVNIYAFDGKGGHRAKEKISSIYCPNPSCEWTHSNPWLVIDFLMSQEDVDAEDND